MSAIFWQVNIGKIWQNFLSIFLVYATAFMLPGFSCSFFASIASIFWLFGSLWSFRPLWCLWRLVSCTWFEWGFCPTARLLCASVHFNSPLQIVWFISASTLNTQWMLERFCELGIALSFNHIQSIRFRTPCQTVQHNGTVGNYELNNF